MNYKSFPDEYWKQIKATVTELKSKNAPLVGAFDADGTLWDTDLGENFFQFQIDEKSVPLPEDPWKHYLDLKKINNDPRDAYIWLAQINAGRSLDEVRGWSQKAFDRIQPKPIFSEQKKLIEYLLSEGVKIYIVTASIKWAVEPGARALGLTDENVIGVETVVTNNIITAEKVLPITYRDGKIAALLKKTGNVAPFLSAGNTIGDYELLEASTHLKLAVSAASRDDRLFKSENDLQTMAIEKNWWRHRFI
jgi:phosphoserine phosphatase